MTKQSNTTVETRVCFEWVSPEWLHQLIQENRINTGVRDSYKIFEIGWGGAKEYDQGHIPGAFYLDTNEVEEKPLWNRKSDQEMEKILLSHGMTHDTTVVLYGKQEIAAARVAVILMYAGVKHIRLLNGGLSSWIVAGYSIEKGTRNPEPVKDFGIKIPTHPNYIVDIHYVKERIQDENTIFADIRSWAEYIGETSGYPYVKAKGRIPGAVWGFANSMEAYRNKVGKHFEIERKWKASGITPDKEVIFYCGTGWRASEAFLTAYLMGWNNISVYDGGWYEWSMDLSNPVETGKPESESEIHDVAHASGPAYNSSGGEHDGNERKGKIDNLT